MAWLLPRTAAASILVVVVVAAAATTTTPAVADDYFPDGAHPTKSGYLDINDGADNSLYYAFYEATPTDPPVDIPLHQVPLIVWLQGGPGCSSLIGNFEEIGPYVFDENGVLCPNKHRWNRRFGVVFIDNPLGSGFSEPNSDEDIPRDQPTIARHLHAALQSFMARHPSFRARPLFLAGESYAGKYIPAAARYILEKNAADLTDNEKKLRLEGIAIGNGMTDPVSQVTVHADQAYFAGLINAEQKKEMEKNQSDAVAFLNATDPPNWLGAREKRNGILDFLKHATGVATLFNYARKKPYRLKPLIRLINTTEAREALRVEPLDAKWVRCWNLSGALAEDIMKSVKEDVEFVLNKTKGGGGGGGGVRVLLFQGVYDLHLGPASVEAWVRQLHWAGLPAFLAANRTVWKPWGRHGVLAGHVQTSGPLTNVVIVGAGHMAAKDNRPAAQAMIEDWVRKKLPFAEAEGQPWTSS